MRKTAIIFIVVVLISSWGVAQKITGSFPLLAGQNVKLEGFSGFKTYPIANTQISKEGNFELTYSKTDYGVGYLMAEDNKPLFVILSGENITLKGEALSAPETIKIIQDKENKLFAQFAAEHPRREQALSAWEYLEKIYKLDSLFALQKTPNAAIAEEKKRIKAEDSLFLAGLSPKSYISWYLPLRKLVSSVSTIAQYRTEEIPSAITAFRMLDYTDPRLYKSGLYKDVIESQFWLLENSGRSLDSVFIEMNLSIDHLVENLSANEKKYNEIINYLFNLLEQRSLFKSSEYLAIKVLNQSGCTLNNDLAKQMETYRAMKKGNTAPDITFNGDMLSARYEGKSFPKTLSELQSKYTVVIFGASWCPKCSEEFPQIATLYDKWKSKGVEVVFVSLDDDKQAFHSFVKVFPFISVCDYQKWNSPIVNAYYVFGTPTMFLLDANRKILLRPDSVEHMNAWVDWYLVQGNPLPNN
jgi:thiol-disulfide isomerase/thioredoxin